QTLSSQGNHILSINPEKDACVIRFDSPELSYAADRLMRTRIAQRFYIAHHPGPGTAIWINRINQITQIVAKTPGHGDRKGLAL
ncbi:hypothetical protein LW990_17685, partial [Erwinia amylovora]|nr:hypothetical protein [Erwinia amylovora]